MASRSLQDLCPELRAKAIELVARGRERGMDILIYCTFRDEKEQAMLYEQGRSRPGPIVTWTKRSKHNIRDAQGKPAAEAFDCVVVSRGKLEWNRGYALQVWQIAKEIGGMRAGLDWDGDGVPYERGEYDSPHFELMR